MQKRTIPVSEVKAGDSIRIGGRIRSVWVYVSALVTVGYTNRKAKRARSKMRRRERLALQ